MASLTGRVFSYYHILDRIGQGGMGTVYRALDRKADREVAIKFISPAIAQQEVFLNRFRREVKAVARLHHPHIVPVLDYGEQHGYAYLVMPLLEVGTLMDQLARGPVALELGARVMDQVAGALTHAHRHGIVHRDVKPSNILLDRDHDAMLSDFGMAQFHDASVSLTGSGLIGTPAYMAPEQARGGPVDARCDQYALGVVLFYLATGSLPFTATSHMEYLLKHVNEPFPAARARNPRVPESVERVLFKATAKNPDDRFASVSEMNHSLQAALAHARDPIGHQAPTIELPPAAVVAPERTVLRSRWRPFRVAAAAAAGLLILAVPVFASGLLGLLQRASSPAEGSLNGVELGQLTLQAGTIQAMSTELAGSQSDPEAIQTAIALTLGAAGRTAAFVGDNTSDVPTFDAAGTIESSLTPTVGLSADGLLQAASPTGVRLAQTSGPDSTPGGTSTNPPVPPSATLSPASSIVPTDTSAGPTATATRTPTPSPSPTQSPVPTPFPTSPPTPMPTAVPTQNPCTLLDLGGFEVSGSTASWNLSNDGSSTVVIEGISLDWPAGNGELDRVRFGNSTIWIGSDDTPPSDIGSGLIGNRSLGGGSKALKFEFTQDAEPGGYDLELELDPGCQFSGGG
ncbi:MAG TPA: protein kinase [Anaerolineales bacterium]